MDIKITVESISHAMFKKCCFMNPHCIYSFRQILNKVNLNELIAYNFEHYSVSYTHFLMMCLFDLWKLFGVREWLGLLRLVESRHDLALSDLIAFMYQYLQVNLVRAVETDSNLLDIREAVFRCTSRNPGLLVTTPLVVQRLDHFEISEQDLNTVRSRLYKEGFPQAEEKHPEVIRLK